MQLVEQADAVQRVAFGMRVQRVLGGRCKHRIDGTFGTGGQTPYPHPEGFARGKPLFRRRGCIVPIDRNSVQGTRPAAKTGAAQLRAVFIEKADKIARQQGQPVDIRFELGGEKDEVVLPGLGDRPVAWGGILILHDFHFRLLPVGPADDHRAAAHHIRGVGQAVDLHARNRARGSGAHRWAKRSDPFRFAQQHPGSIRVHLKRVCLSGSRSGNLVGRDQAAPLYDFQHPAQAARAESDQARAPGYARVFLYRHAQGLVARVARLGGKGEPGRIAPGSLPAQPAVDRHGLLRAPNSKFHTGRADFQDIAPRSTNFQGVVLHVAGIAGGARRGKRPRIHADAQPGSPDGQAVGCLPDNIDLPVAHFRYLEQLLVGIVEVVVAVQIGPNAPEQGARRFRGGQAGLERKRQVAAAANRGPEVGKISIPEVIARDLLHRADGNFVYKSPQRVAVADAVGAVTARRTGTQHIGPVRDLLRANRLYLQIVDSTRLAVGEDHAGSGPVGCFAPGLRPGFPEIDPEVGSGHLGARPFIHRGGRPDVHDAQAVGSVAGQWGPRDDQIHHRREGLTAAEFEGATARVPEVDAHLVRAR